jgi:hypothetical protein
MAEILWAVISEEEDRIPKILAENPDYKMDGIEGVVAHAQECMESDEGKLELLRTYATHRYDAGFRVDDIALRQCFNMWKNGRGPLSLCRSDDEDEIDYEILKTYGYL